MRNLKSPHCGESIFLIQLIHRLAADSIHDAPMLVKYVKIVHLSLKIVVKYRILLLVSGSMMRIIHIGTVSRFLKMRNHQYSKPTKQPRSG